MSTLQEVAAQAGVSLTTASRVLNQSKDAERISPSRARQIREIAQQLGYIGGYHRRTLRNRRAETLGVTLDINAPTPDASLQSGLSQPFHAQVIAGVERITHASGYNLALIVPSATDRAAVRGVVQVRELRVDGLVIWTRSPDVPTKTIFEEAPDLPLAVVLPAVATSLPSVSYDAASLMVMPIDHLASLGHRRLLYFGPDMGPNSPDARDRVFETEMRRRGLTGSKCLYRPHRSDFDLYPLGDREQMISELETYFSQHPRDFTGVVCYNDRAAVACCRVLTRRGLRVPHDVSVTGVDNFDPTLQMIPLTTVDTRLLDLGYRAGQIVLEMVEGGKPVREKYRKTREIIQPKLVVRETTGPVFSQP